MKIEDISKIVAKELNLHVSYIDEINRIQWKFLHKEMQSKQFYPVNIFYIGKFIRKKSRGENRKLLDAKIKKDNESKQRDI